MTFLEGNWWATYSASGGGAATLWDTVVGFESQICDQQHIPHVLQPLSCSARGDLCLGWTRRCECGGRVPGALGG